MSEWKMELREFQYMVNEEQKLFVTWPADMYTANRFYDHLRTWGYEGYKIVCLRLPNWEVFKYADDKDTFLVTYFLGVDDE